MAKPLSEECTGCGWDFSDGGGHTDSAVWNPEEQGRVLASFCQVCMHATTKENGQLSITHIQSLGYMLAHCTNLVLKAIRETEGGEG